MRGLEEFVGTDQMEELRDLMSRPLPDPSGRGCRPRDESVSVKNKAAQKEYKMPSERKKKGRRGTLRPKKKSVRQKRPQAAKGDSGTDESGGVPSEGQSGEAGGGAAPSSKAGPSSKAAPAPQDDPDDCVIVAAGPEGPQLPRWFQDDAEIPEAQKDALRLFGRSLNAGCMGAAEGSTQRHLKRERMVLAMRTFLEAMGVSGWEERDILEFLCAVDPTGPSQTPPAAQQSPDTIPDTPSTSNQPPAATPQSPAAAPQPCAHG
jgi:hypothetical protein